MAETNLVKLKNALAADSIQKRFNDMLGKKSAGFLTSVMNVVQNSALLQKADANSIILAAGQAAALDLPINPNLGFAAIIPFNDTKSGKCVATFQIQRDGWVDLCLRTGQFVYLANEAVYEGELVYKNRFTGEYVFDEEKRKSDKVIGYMAAFKLTNGFQKTVYWTVDEIKAHALRYSQTYKKNFGLWKDNFDAMAKKTVLKHLLKKYAPKSITLVTALESDQASFNGDTENLGHANPVYSDGADIKDAEVVDVQEVPEPAQIEEAPKPSSPAAQPEKGPDQAVQEAPRAGRPRKSAAPQPEPEPEPSPAQEQAVHAPEASEDDIPEF